MLCDFCTGNDPVVVFPVSEFMSTLAFGGTFTNEDGYWSACQLCADWFEQGDVPAIVRRHLDIEQKRFGLSFSPTIFRQFSANQAVIIRGLLEHRDGDAIDINDPAIQDRKGDPSKPMGEIHQGGTTTYVFQPPSVEEDK